MIGKKIAKILPITRFEVEAIKIAKQTNQLQRIPLKNASPKVKLIFEKAVCIAVTPTASPPLCPMPAPNIKPATRIEPKKFAI